MNKKYLSITVLFITVLVLLLVGWLIFQRRANKLMPVSPAGNTSPIPPPSALVDPAYVATAAAKINQVEIDYTDNGFNPAKITIKKGTAVVFTNKSKNPMLVGSKLPEFNQTMAGNVYAYTFTQAGSWDFQNQKHSSDQGTITVTE